jgi:hypothetical protein
MTRIISILIVGISLAWSQSFEAASIRPRVLPHGVFFGDVGVGGNSGMSNLIPYSYDLKSYQVAGQVSYSPLAICWGSPGLPFLAKYLTA